MNARIFLCAALVCVFSLSSTATPGTSLAAPPKQHASPCGAASASHALVEPPDVDVWTLPKDASGERELILAVHRNGDQFCYTYAGDGAMQTQAPVIRVKRGEHFALRLVNDISGPSKGERVAAAALPACLPMPMAAGTIHHYAGYLNHTIDDRYRPGSPIDTNIHLHGFEGPASQEDVFLSTLSTPMHACEYHITIPRTQPPGTYFYHPHIHGATFDQVAGGLDGAWIVEPDGAPIPRSLEHVVVLRYLYPFQPDNAYAPDGDPFLAAAGKHIDALRPAAPVAYDPFAPPPWPMSYPMLAGGVSLDASGCNGSGPEGLISVNGVNAPATLDVPAGQTQLYRIVNGTTDSPKPLQLRDASGKALPLKVVARDGVPISGDDGHPLAHYVAMSQVMVVPSGRADVLISVPEGETYTLSSEHFCDGKDLFFQLHHDLLRIRGIADATNSGSGIASVPLPIVDSPAAKLVAFARAHPASIRPRRAISFTEYYFAKNGKTPAHYAYYITDTTNRNFHEHPFWPVYLPGSKVPAHADIVVKAGTIEEWYLINTTMESHVFHIHQMAFVQEKGPAGTPMTVDDAFLPVGTLLPNPGDPNYPLVKPTITKVLLDFRHVPRGTFVFHCHMLFHEDGGMMGIIRVE